jgi:glutathionylspermidine synthase
VPAPLRSVLKDAARCGATPCAVRTMRFDFHYTYDGWQISEVNSDVPGGYIEASVFTEMIARCVPHAKPVGNPARSWTENVARAIGDCRCVALLSAIGFLEDQQVTAFLASQLQQRGIEAVLLHHPAQLKWEAGRASAVLRGRRVELGAVVRFYQGEWLSGLQNNSGWQWLFARGKTPVTNPVTAVLTESKRFPLTWEFLSSPMTTWRTLLPECRNPKNKEWHDDAEWVLKMAYSNTGDEVHIRDLMRAELWVKLCRAVRRHPEDWILQRRFHQRAIESDAGPVYPCIGVYVIDGVVVGGYARVSTKQVIDYAAIDAAFLVEDKQC